MAFLGQEEQIREYQDRFRYLYVAIGVVFAILTMRLIYLQILQGDKLRRYSEENRIKRVTIPAPRGMIFDRNRVLLIDNRPSFDLEITPQYFRESAEKEKTLERLARIIKMPLPQIKALLEKARTQPSFLPVKIKTDLAREEVAEIETWKIDMPGVDVREEIKRTNVFGDVAAHQLGYIGEVNATEVQEFSRSGREYKLGESIGKFGLERQMESTLRGVDGEELKEVDALGRVKLEKGKGRVLGQNVGRPPSPGKNLILTLDQDLQLTAVKAFEEKIGSVVAMDPSNGQILAMISRPSFDPTEFSRGIPPEVWKSLIENPNHPLRDKTIQDHYSPGSTFKIVTAIAGLEEGVIEERSTFFCPGVIKVGNRSYHCHKKGGHGDVNVVQAITQSCDVFFYRVAQKLKSVDDIAKWATHLGLGRKTGINLAREVPGLIPTEAWKQKRFGQVWNAGETLSVAIGQSFVLSTTLQLATMYSSIANGGTTYRPYLVREIESFEGQTLKEFKPEVMDRITVKPNTLELVRRGLWGVINDERGTARSSYLPGMDFAGKTGTVQVIRVSADKIYQKCQNLKFADRHHGVFVGFAPIQDPKIVVAIIAEHACSGSGGAAPIGKAMIKSYLEKRFPEEYAPAVIAERVKKQGGRKSMPARVSDDDEGVVIDSDNIMMAPEGIE